jgi:hypothetical protein
MWRAKFGSNTHALRAFACALTAEHDDANCIRHGGDSFVKILKFVS